jgi:hypothetical protein
MSRLCRGNYVDVRRDYVEVREELVVRDYKQLCPESADKVAEENADIQPRGA